MDRMLKILLGVLLALIVFFIIIFAILNSMSHKDLKAVDKQEAITRHVADSMLAVNEKADYAELKARADSADAKVKRLAEQQVKDIARLKASVRKLANNQLKLTQSQQEIVDNLFSHNSGPNSGTVVSKGKKEPMTLEEALKKLERDLTRGIEGKK